MAAVETQTATTPSINYRASLPGAPRPALQNPDEPPSLLEDTMQKHNQVTAAPLPPALPRRSMLRASRLFETSPLKLADEPQPALLTRAPHEVYLSSEEDASSSAGDFSEYGDDLSEPEGEGEGAGGDEAGEGVSRKRSYEDVARAVPVVFAGKPTVVDVLPPRARRLQRSSTMPLARAHSPEARRRQNSQPAFLDTDPYAESRESMFKRTIGLVRKRSRPFLNMSNSSQPHLGGDGASIASPVSQSPILPDSPAEDDAPPHKKGRTPSMPPPASPAGAPVTYQDIMRNVRRSEASASAPAGAPVLPTRNRLLKLSVGKRRSVRAG